MKQALHQMACAVGIVFGIAQVFLLHLAPASRRK